MATVSRLYEARVAAGRIKGDPAQRAVLPALDRVAGMLAPQTAGGGWLGRLFGGGTAAAAEGPRGVYLWGGVGRGKSMLMDLVMEAAPTPARRRVHFHAFMQEIQAGLHAARAAGTQDAVRPVAERVAGETRLLCFDEMQITDIADAMIVGRLFQLLFEKGVTVVTTSNRAPEELYKNGLNRELFLPFIDLIRARMEVVELASPRDHRRDRLKGAELWFTPLDAAADRAMDRLWAELTEGEEDAPLILTVHGRRVAMGRACGRVARASFETLCGQPLGPADYLALAASADVLLIDGIPRLAATGFDRAKRFVTLIDALYEAGVRLAASAEAGPDRLYVKGEGAFEFERTASRLAEMQAAGWGAERESAG